ncbi:hypothetical protein FJY90_07180 [Candidatus Gottesmanbacteria bacterium]|nr:hypothetical protein [Candidatus Gottesmanbacteria bacterium]
MGKNQENQQSDFTKLAVATILGILILGAAVYAAYRYSQSQAGNIILPGGVTYLGPSPQATGVQPPTAPQRFTAASDVAWNTYSSKQYPYSFSYPSTLPLVVFPGDILDSVAIAWGNIPPQTNLLINMEFIDKRDASYLPKAKIEYVKNWYKFFSGLKGVAKVEPFTNTNGLRGYKASYVNYAGTAPNTDVFFEVPGQPKYLIHMANGILDPVIFDRIVDSLKWTTPSSTK